MNNNQLNTIIFILFVFLVVYQLFRFNKKEGYDINYYNDQGVERALARGYNKVNRMALLLEDNGIIYRIPRTFRDPTSKQLQNTNEHTAFLQFLQEVPCEKYLPYDMLAMEKTPNAQNRMHFDCYRRRASRFLVPSRN